MRTSNANQYRLISSDLSNLLAAQYKLQKQVLTGQVGTTPSEQGGASNAIMRTNLQMDLISQYRVNLESADSWLTSSETAMQNMVNILTQAKTVAEKMSTGTQQSLEQQTAAEEVSNIFAQLVTLSNTKVNGLYIFGGTSTNSRPVITALAAAGPSSLTRTVAAGHDSTADVVANPLTSGAYAFQIGRNSVGTSSTITISANNTLGETGIVPPLSFDAGAANWITTQTAQDYQAQLLTLRYAFASSSSEVSARIGETFSWTGDSAAGEQTFHSYAKVSFSGAGTATIDIDGAPTYTADSAQELVEAVNASGGDYFAWAEGDDVYFMIKDGVAPGTVHEVSASGGPVSVSYPTLDDLTDQINNGNQATGMVSIDNASLPGLDDTITLGDHRWTWSEITGGSLPADADGYASALASWVSAHTDEYSATATTGAASAGASVIITARAAGDAGNVELSGTNVITSGALMGGVQGSSPVATGSLYAAGESDYKYETTLKCTVLEADADNLTVRMRWYDDEGALHQQDLTMPAAGEDNGVAIPGLDGVTLYRDDLVFQEGTELSIKLGHYQGNEEDIAVSFSSNTHMRYNWNASQLLGDSLTVDLYGETAKRATGGGSGDINLMGAYRGLYSQQFDFDVVDGGQVPGDEVTVRVRWTDQNGNEHEELMTFDGAGPENAQAIPGADGAQFYLDSGTYVVDDSFTYTVEKSTVQLMDMFVMWEEALASGDQEYAQTVSQQALDVLTAAMEQILDYVADSGARQDRIAVRGAVMDDQELYHIGVLEDLDGVDTTQAFIDLSMLQTAYNTSLKVTSTISEMYLVNYIS
ncbi:Flagellin and related hook-associated protein [Desulfarculus baarsii DSM 2075]|uniref:Flagellin and related hook-associated protein n=1 Tax=Desulfarculus baarsii (strain ATCC 33931 / DSM 2075 / LMG 7858 / VKM B-1802 / 2st14) TaxID=644282 RepID=E1QKD3_DESB2|nr:flagellin and related hook-associated protein [Desulfarculus baarsii]ADK86026.1 Flagellin and related hook-associated protein [Desulfarculus baarsii DSM 2075]